MQNTNKNLKIFLATGGSGGHIFPAIAVAEKLKQNGNDVIILADKVYEKYSSCDFKYKIIDAGKTVKSFSNIKNIFNGFFQTRKAIKTEKPDLVIGFGSYATLPTLLACLVYRVPIVLHEQNAYIGKINKLFGKYAKKIMTTYYELYGVKFSDMNKIVYTGSPVRENIKKLYDIDYKYPSINEKFNVLITGGSGGAQIFSEYLPKIFDEKHKEEQKKLKVYHQVREEYVKNVEEYYKKIGLDAVVSSFFNNMDELLSRAHLIIGRAGSGTMCETAVSGKPSIIIPLTNRGNNRQEVNAQSFEKNNASIMILEKDFNIKDFQTIFFDLINSKEKLEQMAQNAKRMAVPDADDNIINVINSVLQK